MDPPAANERPEEEEEEDEPPAQRRRLLVDRKALEASVRSELKEIFQMDEKDECESPSSPATKPKNLVIDSLDPILSCTAVLFHALSYLSPCEIQNVLQSNKKLYKLKDSPALQRILLENIIQEFSIFIYHFSISKYR